MLQQSSCYRHPEPLLCWLLAACQESAHARPWCCCQSLCTGACPSQVDTVQPVGYYPMPNCFLLQAYMALKGIVASSLVHTLEASSGTNCILESIKYPTGAAGS
jgi:hypothetical protein